MRVRDKEARKWEGLYTRFGMRPADFDALLEAQSGVCAICHQPETTISRWGTPARLCVDHDHGTNIVRGLLCRRCNRGIGLFYDDPVILAAAVDYLYPPRTAKETT